MTCPLLIQPRAPFVLSTGHQLEVMRPDAGRQPAGLIGLVPGRDPPAVEDLPRDVMAAADLLADAHDRVAVFIDGALPAPAAGRRFDAVADEFLPEGHGRLGEVRLLPYDLTSRKGEKIFVKIEYWSLVIPSILTVVGWFFAAFWVVRQVNLAHAKNRELQTALLKQAKKDTLAKDFIHIYVDLAQTISDLNHFLYHAQINMALEAQRSDGTKFGWRDAFTKINSSYSTLGRHFDHLRVWLDVYGEQIPNKTQILTVIEKYDSQFTARTRQLDNHPWLLFTSSMAGILSRDKPDIELYNQRATDVGKSLEEIRFDLKEEAKIVEKHLLSPDSIVI
jgi:hypothetical protein